MLTITENNAEKVLDWVLHRGGVAVWGNINMSLPMTDTLTPALTILKDPTPKPSYNVTSQPTQVVTSLDDVIVEGFEQVDTVRISTRVSSSGLYIKLTDASSAKLERKMNHWDEEAEAQGRRCFYRFEGDYAVIYMTTGAGVPLRQWAIDATLKKAESDLTIISIIDERAGNADLDAPLTPGLYLAYLLDEAAIQEADAEAMQTNDYLVYAGLIRDVAKRLEHLGVEKEKLPWE